MPFQSILVSTTADLTDAYETLSNSAEGGEILLAAGADDIQIDLRTGGDGPVTIRSEDPDDLTVISRISLQNVENVTVRDLEVNSTGVDRPAWHNDIFVKGGHGNEISDVTFSSNADGFFDPDDPQATLGASLGHVRETEDFTFTGNHVSNYFQGLSILEVDGALVDNNVFTHLQGDGIRMAGVQDIVISNNHFSDFLGTVQTLNHSDMIQLFTTNAQSVSDNILITGNTFISGEGVATQTIFFNNEQLRTNHPDAELFTNVTITNNLIQNGHTHGISITGGDHIHIADNTLLLNSDSTIVRETGADPTNDAPQIRVAQSENVVIENNLTGGIAVDPDARVDGNVIFDYDNPHDPNFVGNHVVNPFAGSDTEISDLRLRPDSDLIGTGTDLGDPLLVSDDGVVPVILADAAADAPQSVTFDASFTVDTEGFIDLDRYTLQWTFPDGSTQTGVRVSHDFADPGRHQVELRILENGETVATDLYRLDVVDEDFISLDFENGITDASSNETTFIDAGAVLVRNDDGMGLRVGAGKFLITDRENDHYQDLENFGINLDLTVLEGSDGRFLQFHQVFFANVDDEGQVQFQLRTDEGIFDVDSGDTTLEAGTSHQISILYSDLEGQLNLSIDGALVGSVEASGITASQSSHGVVLGSQFTSGVEAIIDNFHFGADVVSDGESDVSVPTQPPVIPEVSEPEFIPPVQSPSDPIVSAPSNPLQPQPVFIPQVAQRAAPELTPEYLAKIDPQEASEPAPQEAPEIEPLAGSGPAPTLPSIITGIGQDLMDKLAGFGAAPRLQEEAEPSLDGQPQFDEASDVARELANTWVHVPAPSQIVDISGLILSDEQGAAFEQAYGLGDEGAGSDDEDDVLNLFA